MKVSRIDHTSGTRQVLINSRKLNSHTMYFLITMNKIKMQDTDYQKFGGRKEELLMGIELYNCKLELS